MMLCGVQLGRNTYDYVENDPLEVVPALDLLKSYIALALVLAQNMVTMHVAGYRISSRRMNAWAAMKL